MAAYRHYGSSNFESDKFEKIVNRSGWIKPFGGLWAEPIAHNKYGWIEWCTDNDFRTGSLDEWFDFEIKDESKIFKISNEQDVYKLKNIGCCKYTISSFENEIDVYFIDFENMLNIGYDAVEMRLTNFTYWALYGWDCDSIIVLNPEAIYI